MHVRRRRMVIIAHTHGWSKEIDWYLCALTQTNHHVDQNHVRPNRVGVCVFFLSRMCIAHDCDRITTTAPQHTLQIIAILLGNLWLIVVVSLLTVRVLARVCLECFAWASSPPSAVQNDHVHRFIVNLSVSSAKWRRLCACVCVFFSAVLGKVVHVFMPTGFLLTSRWFA